MGLDRVQLSLEATRVTEHRRLIETFTLRTANGEAVLQVIRASDGKRIEASGQALLFSREQGKSRAFMADLGCPCAAPVGDLKAFMFPVTVQDTGVDADGTPWRELKLEISHGGASCEGTLTVHSHTAELSVPKGEAVFWSVARIALGEGVAPRDSRPDGVAVTAPGLVRGVESLRLVPGHRQLLGLDTKGGLFTWPDLEKKPRRVVNLELTVTAVNAGPGRAAACGAALDASGAWRVVTVDLESGRLEKVVDSSDDFPFLNARLLQSHDGPQLAVAWENQLRVYERTVEVGRVAHASNVTPKVWLGDRLVVETPEGELGWSPGATALQPLTEGAVHRRGEYELQVDDAGNLKVRHAKLGERTFEPGVESDRRCVRALRQGRPRWLRDDALLLLSDRLIALDLQTLKTWVVVEGPDTELRALLQGRTLVIDQQASGRPKYVDVR